MPYGISAGSSSGAVTSDDVINSSGVEGSNVTQALNDLIGAIATGVDGVLFDIPSDISTSIPFQFLPASAGTFTPPVAGDYRIILSLIVSMSNTNRSFLAELRLNGQPLAGVFSPNVSVEMKDSTNREPMTIQRRIPLVLGDELEFVFGPESFGSTAFIRGGSQFEIFKVDV